ncbi:cobalamin-binding protein [Marinobacter sp. VGCF2001]|uniref:cobalamin-binding protein n=1 Tax=Marinobacter sp. VGCF2001 TaxID=3417189 RepID=UPI003CE71FE7
MLIRFFILFFALIGPAAAEVCATDDNGKGLCLPAPAQRIVALSPGAAELVFAAGAGDRVVAVVEYSDYPPAAKQLPRVGNHTRIDLETLVELDPDLVITWVSGNPAEQVALLEQLGLPQFAIEPRTLEGVATALERLGTLTGASDSATAEATRFRTGIAALARQYQARAPIRVFYQVWDQPLMTISNDHLIGKVIRMCGGQNIFGDMDRLVPRIGPEDVLARNPQAILTGSSDSGDRGAAELDLWRQFPSISAVAHGNLLTIPASPISRPTPRLLEGARNVCEKLDLARDRLR